MAKFTKTQVTDANDIDAAIDTNLTALETFSDQILTRDGISPNNMNADLDLNGNSILNVGEITFGDTSFQSLLIGDRIFIDATGITTTSGDLDLSSFTGLVCINGNYCLPPTDGTGLQVMQTDGAGQVSFAALPAGTVSQVTLIDSGDFSFSSGGETTVAIGSTATTGAFSLGMQQNTDLVHITANIRIRYPGVTSECNFEIVRDVNGPNEAVIGRCRMNQRNTQAIHSMMHVSAMDFAPTNEFIQYNVRLRNESGSSEILNASDGLTSYQHFRVVTS